MYRAVFVVIVFISACGVSNATDCPSSTMDIAINSTTFLFNSPNFPADYPRPLSCKWMFTGADGTVLNFRIMTFDVFPSIFCLKDVLDILDGNSKYSPVMQSWCGTRPAGQVFQTSTQYALFTYQAVTEGDSRQGFEFEVWSEIQYLPDVGETELSPVHLSLLAVFVVLAMVFVGSGIVIALRERREKRLKEQLTELG